VRAVVAFVKMQLEEELKSFIHRQNSAEIHEEMKTITLKFVHNVPIERIYFNCTITPEGVKIEE